MARAMFLIQVMTSGVVRRVIDSLREVGREITNATSPKTGQWPPPP
jgi:hypothetical protein